MAERQRRVQENAVERQTRRRNRIQQGRDGLSADERTPEEKFKEAQEIAKSRRRVLGLENNRREQDEVFGGTAWDIAQAAAGHEMDEDKKQLQVVIAKEQPEDDLTPGGEPDIPRQVQRQGERQRMPPEPDAAKRKQNVQQNARQREDERRKRLGKEPREDEPEVDVPFEDKLEDRRDRVQDRAIERNQERKDRLQQRRGHMAIGAARTQDGLANMAMNEALEGPNEFVAPRAHEAVQTRPGRETDGLPHETFGKAVVDATKASTRAMERLSGELGEALARIEQIERDIEMRGHA